MRIYIAARDQHNAKRIADLLREWGHEICSSWLTERGYASIPDRSDASRSITARTDQLEVEASDGLVLIAEPDGVNVPGGKHVETGIAIAHGKRVWVLGRRENIFHWHPLVTFCASEADLLEQLK